ncbi:MULTISPECIES: sigma-54-dependent transcriptional regulator [Paracoccus]|jgi:two-component system C4-dicarboxylate transport response regulator DctD|uniref:Nif-specific regulatory protein n=1 Tax=Paracoccus denitrificans (strain Pd 1222) TaxID=318586 RepID=A1BAC5_PARDP|nr:MULTISPECIES: sigma-54 dependent transcriptional regulator [Paracoccus]ABL72469.1 two component, sigma54 specific, transcriptional regulator, Fis family [Paracoccus denitrificans PD1222]MBB4626460.1 two-component system C4-dicarboxylate transport response regulator DctD [Paracoccus denitrificans]MCU7430364.1 sigma-54 dependent transcriptional regulator [Paracoccus denitrificans]QAR29017.1 sigma-54-dependent Fis family transcriptional regulator [Paracoccus denitrificans]UFS66865.1 sigma-54 d
MTPRVLLVEDDEQMRSSTAQALELAGFTVEALASGEEALALAGSGFAGAVVSDIRMPGMDGMTLLGRLHEVDPEIPVILVTGHAEVPLAVEAIRGGAYDFIEKPFVVQELATVIRRAIDHRGLVLENRRLRAVAGKRDDVEARLPGRTQVMVDLRYRLRAIGASDADALVIGPTGAGKEVVARTLHDISARAGRPFIAINCAALPEALIESELFGHEPGAFPGALRPRYGKFEHARGGTVLLDEIGSMPLELQAKLLRVLQERTITRLGSNDPVPLDVRFIAVSKVDLEELVAQGLFREDLLWRLNVAVLHVPPLSARREDIPLLFLQLLREAAARHNLPEREAPAAFLSGLAAKEWPGNVRELRNLAERFVLGLEGAELGPEQGARLAERVAEFERSLIAGAIAAHGGKLRPVYETLGISRKTLYEKMQKYGLDRRLILDAAEDDAG